MLDPYRMIAVNIIASGALLGGVLFYRYIFPKRNINLLVLLLLISLLPLISILRKGVYESGDFSLHIYRTVAFYKSLQEGILIPSWAGDLNALYGYPLFLFNYNFPYYIISFFHFLGFSFIFSMKLFLSLSFISSGIFMYLWAKNEFKNDLAAFTSAIFYLYSPYHLIDLHFRVTIGELTVFALLPLLLYFIQRFISTYSKIFLLYISLILSFIILSHAGIAVFSFFITIPYTAFHLLLKHKIKQVIPLTLSFILGITLSSFIILPYHLYAKYTFLGLLTSTNVSFVPIRDLIISPWRMGFLFQGPKGELSFIAGYTQILVLLSVIFLYFKNIGRSKFNRTALWLTLTFLLLFLITPLSYIVWNTLSFLNVVQFSFRLLLLVSLCVSVLAGILALSNRKKTFLIFCLLALTIGYTILNWGNRRVIPEINDRYLIRNVPKSTYEGEGFCCAGSPIWTDINNPWFKNIPKSYIEIVDGQAEWRTIWRSSTKHEYVIFAKTQVLIRENTEYFPGWTATNNLKEIPIKITKNYPKGIMEVNLSPGLHHIKFEYKDFPILFYSKMFNVVGTISILGFLILYNLNRIIKGEKAVI